MASDMCILSPNDRQTTSTARKVPRTATAHIAADDKGVTSPLRILLAALVLAVAAAGPADAASKHPRSKAKRTAATKTVAPKRKAAKPVAAVPVATPAPTPAPVATPTVTSVISIGGYVFYNLTYAEAVDAYAAAVAAAPAGYTPPPVTSVSVDVTVGV
jgi:hypothetical protein